MWNKRDDHTPANPQPEAGRNAAPPVAIRPPAPPAPPRPAAAASKQSAAIGASMQIKGEIRTREELVVDGEVEGSIESQSVLTVGPSGKVRANIKAREVVVFGLVRGNVEVTEKIAIRDQGSVVGDIKAAGISIDDGSYFKGSIDIVRPDPKLASQTVKNEPRREAAAG
ncbi:MAG: polymer-forming cytoskeletal protein [Acidobacteria bacterium]|nr:polymer-forming cytoskeletal protein [Acidobacteriota bacterium]